MFWFALQYLSETFLIITRSERDIIKTHIGLSAMCRYYGHILMVHEFSWQIFEKFSKLTMKICPVVSELFHENRRTDGKMDRHDEVNNRFSQFFTSLKHQRRYWRWERSSSLHTCMIYLGGISTLVLVYLQLVYV